MNKEKSISISRESNIELLRIIASIGVIVLHFNLNGGLEHLQTFSGGGYNTFLLLECFFICSVDLFIFISGYFSWKNSTINIWKVLSLLIEVICIKILFGILSSIRNHAIRFSISWLIPNNYFVIFYVALLFLAPYINRMVETSKNKKILLVSGLVLFSIYPTLIEFGNDVLQLIGKNEIVDISTITRQGSLDGYTIVNFVLMYALGCVYHHCEDNIAERLKGKQFILVIAIIVDVILIFVWTKLSITYTHEIIGTSLSYCNPLVILDALLVFTLFKTIKINSVFVNRLAKASFTAYLVHGYFLSIMVTNAPFENLAILILYVFIGSLAIYAISFVIYLGYRFTVGRVMNHFEKGRQYIIKVQ